MCHMVLYLCLIVECKDLYPDSSQCLSWKNEGQCEKNPGWMYANCRKTCGICPTAPESKYQLVTALLARTGNVSVTLFTCILDCANKAGDAKCYADASVGECSANAEYMIENCGLACGKCKYHHSGIETVGVVYSLLSRLSGDGFI